MSGESTDIEFSPKRLEQLTLIAASGDDDALAAAVTDIPSLVLEVTRLRQELAERIGERDRAKKRTAELKSLVDALRPSQEAQLSLDELKGRVADVMANADKDKRELADSKRSLEAAEARIRSLITSMTELARASGGEALVKEKERADKAEDRMFNLEQENHNLRERIARMERVGG